MDKLKRILNTYVNDPLDPYINARLGEEYEIIGQGAAALSLPDSDETTTSIDSEAHSNHNEGCLEGTVHLLHNFLTFREIKSSLTHHVFKPFCR